MKVVDSGRLVESSVVQAADRLITLKKKHGSNPWPCIEECIKIWIKKSPDNWNSHIVNIQNLRRTRKDPKFASTYDKKHGGYLRYTLDIPQEIIFYIRKLYTAEELPMNREFFIEWAKRFPVFKVAKKL